MSAVPTRPADSPASTALALHTGLTLTGDLTRALTAEEAAQVTTDARTALAGIEAAALHFRDLIARAYYGKAHRALHYDSWAAYCADAFGPLGELRIPIAVRAELVRELHNDGRGLAKRQIASALRIADHTVRADLKRNPEPSDTAAEESAEDLTTEPAPATQPEQALAALLAAGPKGLTHTELARRHRGWRTGAWAVLSRLHTQHRIERLHVEVEGAERAGLAVYVHPDHVADRAVEAPGRRRGVLPE